MCVTIEQIKELAQQIEVRIPLATYYATEDLVKDGKTLGCFLVEKKCSPQYLMAFNDKIQSIERICVAELIRFARDDAAPLTYYDELLFLKPRLLYRYTRASQDDVESYEGLHAVYSAFLSAMKAPYEERNQENMRRDMSKLKEFFQAVVAHYREGVRLKEAQKTEQ